MMELFMRPLRHQLGAEELLELGRPVRLYRYSHTPFLAGRHEQTNAVARGPVNLLRQERNILGAGVGQAAPAEPTLTLTKVLVVGIPVLIVVGLLATNK